MDNRRTDKRQRNPAHQGATSYKARQSTPFPTEEQNKEYDRQRQMKLEAGQCDQEPGQERASIVH